MKPFIVSLAIVASLFWAFEAHAQTPITNQQRNIIPALDSSYYLGTTTGATGVRAWLRVIADSFYDTDASDGCAQWVSNVLTSSGTPCGSGSGGGGGGTWATTTSQVANQNINYSLLGSDIVTIGATSSTSAEFYFDPNLGFSYLSSLGVGTTSLFYQNQYNAGITLGLNQNIVLTTNRNTNNFVGNIIFKNEQASTTKSGLEWYGFENPNVSRAWLVFHESLNGEMDGSHGAPHLEIETSDTSGAKQGRWTVQSDCDYDCIQTFNQSEVYINRNSGQTNGNLLFNGGGQIRNTGVMQIIPLNAINTKGFRISTSTDNDIMIDVTSGTELEVADNINLTGSQFISGSLGIGTTSPVSQLTIEKSGASGTTVGSTIELRQNQTTINQTTNSTLGEILFSGADVLAGETGVGARIRVEATAPWNGTTNDYPSAFVFSTNPDGASALTERLRIGSDGQVTLANDFLVSGSTTLQNFTGRNATTTNFSVTSNSLMVGGNNHITATTTSDFRVASTTLDARGISFSTGTTSIQIATFPEARTLTSLYCVASSTGSVRYRIGDGTNWANTNSTSCSTTGARTYFTTTNTFTADETVVVEIGTSATSPSTVTLSPTWIKSAP